jgi:uncharacterized membrane protein required for colicin V production
MHTNYSAPAYVPINWFDMVVVIIILFGLNKGRKRGMSEEIMVTVQWVVIIFAGAFLYKPLGDMLAASSPMSHVFCYITIYITAAIVTKIFFGLIKKAAGGKLIGSDVFGSGEYYLGMFAGAIRYACMLVAALAVMNAPYYSPQDLNTARAYQNDNYGSNFFPEFSSVQQEVFKDSFVGSFIKKKAAVMLIASTKSESAGIQRRSLELP